MSVDGWKTVLVLGGIRSGKSAFAESLVAGAPSVRYVATAVGGQDDAEWLERIEAHQRRRPQSWSTEETGGDPERLAVLVAEADPADTLLVDDIGGWVATLLDPERQPHDDEASVAALAEAVRACPGRLVLVSPEVGLSLVPTTPLGRAFADALGTTNQALAAACDRVALVVAGQPTWLKPPAATPRAADPTGQQPAADPTGQQPAADPIPAPAGGGHHAVGHLHHATGHLHHAAGHDPGAIVADLPPGAEIRHPHHDEAPTATANGSVDGGDAFSTPTMALPLVTTGARIQPGMDLPLPDETAGAGAQDRLAALDVAGAGFGALRPVVEFLAEAQGTPTPRAWSQVHVIALHGRHEGGASAGADPADVDRQLTRLRAGDGPLAVLAATAGAQVQVVDTAHSAAMEAGEVLSGEAVDAAVRQGWDLADAAVSGGADALVIAAYGTGGTAAAAAVVAATTGAEPVAVLGRVLTPGGYVDDHAWMVRCAAVRDALHRIRRSPRGPRDILAQLGGADIAVATGVVLGAAARRVPVLLDGPVGAAAGLVSRDYAAQARHWCLLVDDGGQPAVRQAADVLGLEPFLGLRLDLGEGANALAALPLLRAAVDLAARLGPHPALADGGYAEPASAGPGPTAVSA